MDTSRLPKIQDEERESQFGYVHGVSGPGVVKFPSLCIIFNCLAFKRLESTYCKTGSEARNSKILLAYLTNSETLLDYHTYTKVNIATVLTKPTGLQQ